jgi:peroxiredoxin
MALRDLENALQSTEEIKITVTGRTSGRKISLPVWFVEDGKAVHLLPVRGSDTEWYKNLLKNRTIALAAKGAKWTARKVTVIKDRGRVRKVAEMFRAKHGAGDVTKYYTKLDVAVRIPLG